MTRKSFATMNCSWAQAAEVIADKWSILIVRDALLGVRTFSVFARNLGIAKNILAQRLEHLQEHGVLRKDPVGIGSTRYEYSLTPKGRALFPLMTALGQWGDAWILREGNEPWLVVEHASGRPIANVRVQSQDGRPLQREDVTFVAGPGANERTAAIASAIERSRKLSRTT